MRLSRSRTALVALPAVAGALALGGLTAPASADDGLFAKLSGAKEVPGPGDPNGSGAAIVSLYPSAGRVCAKISVARLDPLVAGHIHRGGPHVAGPVVVDLTGSVTGGALCVSGVDSALITDIREHPGGYYVNVHSTAYPAGAARGQLQG